MPRIPNAFTVHDPRIQPIPETGCWLWTGCLNKAGYGWTKEAPRVSLWLVHRAVWMRLVGPIPEGLVLDHRCRVRSCCNPDHLRIVTRAVNNTENSEGICVKYRVRPVCPKCGGSWGTRIRNKRGRKYEYRECKACAREYNAMYAVIYRSGER